MVKIIERTKIWFSISLAVILVGVVLFFARGFNFGIDFKGGTKLVIEFGDTEFQEKDVNEIINKYAEGAACKVINDTEYEIKAADLDENKTAELFSELKEKYELSDDAIVTQDQIGASVGKELTRKAVIAVLVACVAMLIYIAFRFEVTFGVAALIALFHDVLVTMTVYLLFNITVNSPFIAAMLTIVGYSINDTIVVFDRIRENRRKMFRNKKILSNDELKKLVNTSSMETINRNILTSITTIVAVLTLIGVGLSDIFTFNIAILIGLIAGSISSLIIAPRVWILLERKSMDRPEDEDDEVSEMKIKGVNC